MFCWHCQQKVTPNWLMPLNLQQKSQFFRNHTCSNFFHFMKVNNSATYICKYTTREQYFQNVLLSIFWYLYACFICLFSLPFQLHSFRFYFTSCFLRRNKQTNAHTLKQVGNIHVSTLRFKKILEWKHQRKITIKWRKTCSRPLRGQLPFWLFNWRSVAEALITGHHRELAHFLF